MQYPPGPRPGPWEHQIVRKLLFAFIALGIGLATPLLVAEIALRFLPVSTALFAQPVDEANPIFRFQSDRDYLWSNRWNFTIVNGGRVNNAGFVNDQDYRTNESSPLLAVIGDSYVEATMVPYAETLQGRLATALEGRGRVYSFAASGAPLSQYLAWARHARDVYEPDAMVFVVVGNDYDESLLVYKQGPGFHHYREADDGELSLTRIDYAPNPLRAIVRRSALARYLIFNLQALETVARLRATFRRDEEEEGDEEQRFLGNVPRYVEAPRLADSKRAVDAFFRDLPAMSGLAPSRILFVVDGIRYPGDYDPTAYIIQMRRYLLEQAHARGYGAIDMEEHFLPEHAANGTRFEFPTDAHWNGIAHGLAAAAVAGTALFKKTFPASTAHKP